MHKVGCHPGSHNAAYRPLPLSGMGDLIAFFIFSIQASMETSCLNDHPTIAPSEQENFL